MISFGNGASSHSGLFPLKTSYKKREELLLAIASKENFINLHSACCTNQVHQDLMVVVSQYHLMTSSLPWMHGARQSVRLDFALQATVNVFEKF